MKGIDRLTGRTIDGFKQLVSRITQVMTSPLSSRAKRPGFGSRVRESLSANMSDGMLMVTQSRAIEAFYNPVNGIGDFLPTSCIARRGANGLSLYFEGVWLGRNIKFEVVLDVPA